MTSRAPVLVADGLWNCLCPGFSQRAFAIASRKRVVRPDSLTPRRRQHNVSYAPTTPIWPPVYRSTRNPTPKIPNTPLTIDPPTLPPTDAKEVEKAREASEEQLLAQLDHFAQEANKVKVQELLIILVKELGKGPDPVHYEALLLAEADPEHGSAAEVERLLGLLDVEGIPPDTAMYHAALRALAVHPNYVLREQVLTQMEQRWLDLNEGGWHSVTAALFRERQIELGLERLSNMQIAGYESKPWLLHLAIATCLSIDAFPEALALLKHRTTYSEPVPSALWAECLTKAAHALCHPLVDFIWRRAVEASYLNPSSGTCVAVLDTAARYGNFRLATDVFRVLGARASPLQTHHYEALMQAYLTAGDLPAAMSVLRLMATSGHGPDVGTCRPLFRFLTSDAATRVPHCLALLVQPLPRIPMASSKRKPKAANEVYPAAALVLSACIEALVRVRAFDAARSLLNDWPGYCPHERPGLQVYNALLLGASWLTDATLQRELAAEWLATMDEHGIEPDQSTLERLLVIHLGPKEVRGEIDGMLGALACFEKLRIMGVTVPSTVQGHLLSKLVRSRQIDAARYVARSWGTQIILKEGSIDATEAELRATGRILKVDDGEGRRKWAVKKEAEPIPELDAEPESDAT